MSMKTMFIIGFSVLFQFGMYAQKSYSKELLNSYKDSELALFNEEQMEVLEYAIDHACYLIAVPPGKDISKFSEINLSSENKLIRYTDLGLKIQEVTQYFKVADKPKLLVVKSSNILKLEKQNLKK